MELYLREIVRLYVVMILLMSYKRRDSLGFLIFLMMVLGVVKILFLMIWDMIRMK